MALKLKKSKSKQRLMAEFLENVSQNDELSELLEAAAAAPAEGEGGPGMDTPLQATAKMAAAIFMDESMDTATKRAKIGKLLDLIDDAMPATGAEGEGDAAGSDGETSVKEGKGSQPSGKLGKAVAKPAGGKELTESKDDTATQLKQLVRKDEIRDMCEDAGFRPSKVQLKSLMLLEDDEEVQELIESWAGKDGKESKAGGLGPNGGSKPKSKPAGGKALLEGKTVTDEELKALLR
jgi:hypothetical protein